MKRELKKIILLEAIKKKANDQKMEVAIYCRDLSIPTHPALADMDEIIDMIHELEEETKGKIKLIHPTALSDPNNPTEDEKILGLIDYYYRVFYDPEYISSKKDEEKIKNTATLKFILSNQALYRYLSNGDLQEYKIGSLTIRRKIICALESNYRSTEDLARDVGCKKTQTLRGSIKGLRKILSSKFPGIEEYDFIEGRQREGYRLAKDIQLKITTR